MGQKNTVCSESPEIIDKAERPAEIVSTLGRNRTITMAQRGPGAGQLRLGEGGGTGKFPTTTT
jgi:hypothetical protein